jgi:hypothetical protein
MLGLPEVSRHAGTVRAHKVRDILKQFKIENKIRYAVLDNAINNDIIMAELGRELGFSDPQRRGRCIGHTINLSSKALLFGDHADVDSGIPYGSLQPTVATCWQSDCLRKPLVFSSNSNIVHRKNSSLSASS